MVILYTLIYGLSSDIWYIGILYAELIEEFVCLGFGVIGCWGCCASGIDRGFGECVFGMYGVVVFFDLGSGLLGVYVGGASSLLNYFLAAMRYFCVLSSPSISNISESAKDKTANTFD